MHRRLSNLCLIPRSPARFSAPSIPSGYNLVYAAQQLDLYSLSGPNTWAVAGSGSWNNPSNWSTLTIPNGPGVLAVMGTVPNTATIVTLDAAQELGSLVFNSTADYTIAAGSGGTLTLSNTGGLAGQIVVLSGSHTISAPLILAGTNSIIALSGGGNLNISGGIMDGSGGSSALIISSSDNSGRLTLSGSNNYGMRPGSDRFERNASARRGRLATGRIELDDWQRRWTGSHFCVADNLSSSGCKSSKPGPGAGAEYVLC